MLNLDEVISHVERLELSADTRQRHLARLHALQVAPVGARPVHPEAAAVLGRARSRTVLAGVLAAAAVAAVAGTSAGLSSAHHSTVAPTSVSAGAATVRSSVPQTGDRQTASMTTTGTDSPELSDAQFSSQLAGILGLTKAQAQAVTAQLNELPRHGGVDPASPTFTQIAAGAGVSPARLVAAIDQIKKAQLAELATTASSGPAQPNSGKASQPNSGQPKAAVLPPTSPPASSGTPIKNTAPTTGLNLLTTDRSINLLASTLGLNHQKSVDLAGKLAVLAHGGGLDPHSTSFQTVADHFGLTPDQLAGAIDQIKKSGN